MIQKIVMTPKSEWSVITLFRITLKRVMTAQSFLSSTILKRVMTVFLFVLTQKRVMAPFNDNVLGLMRVMCGTRVTLLSFGTKE